jgi:hypothetical protein
MGTHVGIGMGTEYKHFIYNSAYTRFEMCLCHRRRKVLQRLSIQPFDGGDIKKAQYFY